MPSLFRKASCKELWLALKGHYAVQRILYNPGQTPVKATPEPAQPQTAGEADQEQNSKLPEPIMASGAGHDDAGLPDILDQLMADGLVQDVPAAKADDADLNHTTGTQSVWL